MCWRKMRHFKPRFAPLLESRHKVRRNRRASWHPVLAIAFEKEKRWKRMRHYRRRFVFLLVILPRFVPLLESRHKLRRNRRASWHPLLAIALEEKKRRKRMRHYRRRFACLLVILRKLNRSPLMEEALRVTRLLSTMKMRTRETRAVLVPPLPTDPSMKHLVIKKRIQSPNARACVALAFVASKCRISSSIVGNRRATSRHTCLWENKARGPRILLKEFFWDICGICL